MEKEEIEGYLKIEKVKKGKEGGKVERRMNEKKEKIRIGKKG